jgi:hypothetical protein
MDGRNDTDEKDTHDRCAKPHLGIPGLADRPAEQLFDQSSQSLQDDFDNEVPYVLASR